MACCGLWPCWMTLEAEEFQGSISPAGNRREPLALESHNPGPEGGGGTWQRMKVGRVPVAWKFLGIGARPNSNWTRPTDTRLAAPTPARYPP
jgi:hypothetical protein